jgi:YspA, cpYpsA-related SLOG family
MVDGCARACDNLDMRILLTGDRCWACDGLAYSILRRIIARHGLEVVIIHAGGCGVDNSFSRAAEARGLTIELHLLQIHHLGRGDAAHHAEMVKAGADLCLVVHRSLVTDERVKDCAYQAIAAGIPTFLIDGDHGIPDRLSADDPRLAPTER